MDIKTSNKINKEFLQDNLKKIFGFNNFRGKQEDIILNLLSGNDSMVIMPTGGGKSMCYQLPALLSEGVAIVISPLIALMKNQVDALRGYSENDSIAHVLNSSLSKTQSNQVKEDIKNGLTKLVYVAPESLIKEENIAFFNENKISFFAIDEAHCISEWGHDFRPEYRKLRQIINNIAPAPVIALTATATPKVRLDIMKNLRIEDAKLYLDSFNRKNLFYEIRPKLDIAKQLIKYINERKEETGIVYCLSRKKVEEIAEVLQINGIKALPYHAGLETKKRVTHQDAFLMEECDVIVATIAFGMGIDKPDIRFVIHHDIPKSLEGYYQETGRAGRDGSEGHCLAFYSYKDIEKLTKFLSGKPIAEKEQSQALLDEIAAYAETSMSRRKFILNYFGEIFDEINGEGSLMDDNMINPKEKIKVNKELKTIIKLILETKEQYRIKDLISCLMGIESNLTRTHDIKKNKFFGTGKSFDKIFWKSLFSHMLVDGLIYKVIESYGVIKLNEKSKKYLDNNFDYFIQKNHDFNDQKNVFKESESTRQSVFDKQLFSILIEERKKMAKKKGIPPYVIFQEYSLEEMALKYPISVDELKNLNGVGEGKAKKFGIPFLELIKNYVKENEIQRPDDIIIKTTGSNSSLKLFIIQSIDRKLRPIDIANSKGIELTELIDELQTIVFSGTKLNIDYMVNEIFDDDQQDELYDFFIDYESDDINEAIKEFGDDYEELDLKLYRIKFLNDISN